MPRSPVAAACVGFLTLTAWSPLALGASPLAGEMARLDPLLGTWTTEESMYALDGTVRKEIRGGRIEFEPTLRGTYLLMHADAGHVDPEADPLLWMFCYDAGEGVYVARGFTAGDPTPAVAHGRWKEGTLVFERKPGTDVPPVNFRFTIDPTGEDEIRARLEMELEERWVLRATEVWRRLE